MSDTVYRSEFPLWTPGPLQAVMRCPQPPLVYLAGPMRGYAEYNFPAFWEAESALAARGYKVISPARMDIEKPTEDTNLIIRRDLNAVLKCEYIALMLGWQRSVGASAEAHVAEWAGKKFLFQDMRRRWSFPETVHLSPSEVL